MFGPSPLGKYVNSVGGTYSPVRNPPAAFQFGLNGYDACEMFVGKSIGARGVWFQLNPQIGRGASQSSVLRHPRWNLHSISRRIDSKYPMELITAPARV